MAKILLVLILIGIILVVLGYAITLKQVRDYKKKWDYYNAQLIKVTKEKEEIEEWIEDFDKRQTKENAILNQLKEERQQIERDVIERKHQIDIDIAIEAEKKRVLFEIEMEKNLEELKASSEWKQLETQLQAMKDKVEESKKTLSVIDQKFLDLAKEEDFNTAHSIKLSENDKDDIKIITALVNELHNKEVIQKLIWTYYYQKPLQVLRKELNLDRTMGIYRITNKRDGRCYIGQSTDIGNRLTEHFKSALIGKAAAQTSKLYQIMGTEGPENFTYEVIETCEREKLNEKERYWIDFYNSKTLGYNMTIGG